MKKTSTRIGLCIAWLISVASGVVALSNYDFTPGGAGQTPMKWPSNSSVSLDRARPTLLMFAHPLCPCTSASIGELNRLLARCEGQFTTHVFFLQTASLPNAGPKSETWREAEGIPNVSVHGDPDGALARQFGAETSGFVVLFSQTGQLLFKGGITAGRGHAGDNAGANMIAAVLAGRETSLRQTPVYGCSLGKACASTRPGGEAWTQ